MNVKFCSMQSPFGAPLVKKLNAYKVDIWKKAKTFFIGRGSKDVDKSFASALTDPHTAWHEDNPAQTPK